MAMSRSFGGTRFTTRPPIAISPALMFSRPASMRSRVDLPQPEGPTSTTNSPSEMSTLTPCSTSKLPKDLRTFRMSTVAILPPLVGRATVAARSFCLVVRTWSEARDGGFLGGDELQQHRDARLGLLDAPAYRGDDLGRVRHAFAVAAEGAGHG